LLLFGFGDFYNPFLGDNKPCFEVVILSYNNEKYYQRNLDSVVHQITDTPFHITYVNDCSTDHTGELVDLYRKEHHLEDLITVIHNKERVGMLANMDKMVHSFPDYAIIINIDGDDSLIHNKVIDRVVHAYRNKNLWFVYGQMIYYYHTTGYYHFRGQELPKEIMENNLFREYAWVTSHLKTFYAGLFKKINREDFFYENSYFDMSGDLAYTYPMLEMASQGHIGFIPEILYLYNYYNPISDHNRNVAHQITLENYIRSKKRYAPLIQKNKNLE
jgi:glycosyltransferase involved in cell wall biosynthesis